MKAVVLDPKNGFNVDKTLTKADVQKLIEVSTCFGTYAKGFCSILYMSNKNITLFILGSGTPV